MPILKEIEENLKAVANIEAVTKTYQEIANLRMNKIRQEVLDNRDFIDELSRIYSLAKKSRTTQTKEKGAVKNKKYYTGQKKQRVAVFLSCNERFHGPLILNIWKELFDFLNKNKADLIVIGRIGKYLAERSGFGHRMFYLEMDDDEPEKEKIKGFIESIRNYRQIIIFHGRFQTILSQKVTQSDISGGTIQERELDKIKDYLFEPSPEAVLDFFETELISAFLNQTILEHRLSRYATRMIAMHQATGSAKEKREQLEKERKKLKRQLSNKEQIEIFSGLQLWT